MKKLTLTCLAAALAALAGCQQDSTEQRMPSHTYAWSPSSLAAGPTDTFDHPQQSVGSGVNGITDPTLKLQSDEVIGTPDVVARLHGAQKMQCATLGRILTDLGVDLDVDDGVRAPVSFTPRARAPWASRSTPAAFPR